MSRATLFVRFPDGTIRYGIYNGTSDIARPPLFDTLDGAWAHRFEDWPDYEEESGEPVDVATNYGGGFSWKGTATKEYLTSGHNIMEVSKEDYKLDLPSWAK
jgi:hypothetical protein